jgi:hypothetical protein
MNKQGKQALLENGPRNEEYGDFIWNFGKL